MDTKQDDPREALGLDDVPDDPRWTSLRTNPDAISRGVEALCRFVFPGVLVPRHEMAEAVIVAVNGVGDWRADLPKRRVLGGVHSIPLPLASSGDSESSDLQGDSAEDSR